jgi:hypothetical protein
MIRLLASFHENVGGKVVYATKMRYNAANIIATDLHLFVGSDGKTGMARLRIWVNEKRRQKSECEQ